MLESRLKMFSIGIVVEDKDPDSDYIYVNCIEHINIRDTYRMNRDNIEDLKSNLKDTNGKGFDTEIKATPHVKAKWLGFGLSNRLTSPDVYKGETVMVFKFADADDYYWATMMREPKLRKKETVVYVFSNEPEPLKEYTLDTSYWVLVDTRNKTVKLHTSDNDGEYTTYDVTIKTDEGYLEIIDGKGNFIKLDSTVDKLTATIHEDIEFNTKRMVVNASESVTINTTDYTNNSSATLTNNTQVYTTNATTSITNNTQAHTNNNEAFTVNSKAVTFNTLTYTTVAGAGTVWTTPMFALAGSFSMGGGGTATMDGDMQINAKIKITEGIESLKPIVAPLFEGTATYALSAGGCP